MVSKDSLTLVSDHAQAVVYRIERVLHGRQSASQNQKHLEYARERLRAALALLEGTTAEPTHDTPRPANG